MAINSEQVAHANLVSGSETTLHAHAGGGSGPIIKSGQITTDGSGVGSVSFATPFSDTGYAILLTAQYDDGILCMWSSKATGGFSVNTESDKGITSANRVVDWIAIPYNNS